MAVIVMDAAGNAKAVAGHALDDELQTIACAARTRSVAIDPARRQVWTRAATLVRGRGHLCGEDPVRFNFVQIGSPFLTGVNVADHFPVLRCAGCCQVCDASHLPVTPAEAGVYWPNTPSAAPEVKSMRVDALKGQWIPASAGMTEVFGADADFHPRPCNPAHSDRGADEIHRMVLMSHATAEAMVSLGRYPLADTGARAAIVARARDGMAAEGCAVLPGFLRPEAVELIAEEASALAPVSHRRDRMLGAYDDGAEAGMDPDHPAAKRFPYRMRVTATDQLDPSGAMLTVYEWEPLTRLVADILNLPRLYRCADPLMRCNFTILGDGDEHGWHFDGNDFVVSLLVQKPEAGGTFEFAPGVRDERNENFDTVRAIMDGTPGLTRTQDVEPGTLVLFRGKRALHRVTRVSGARARIIALLSFDERPGMMFGADAQRRVFGRTEAEAPVP